VTDIKLGGMVTSVASTVIAAGIIWAATELHNHDIALQKQTDKLDLISDTTKGHSDALAALVKQITGEPDGLLAKTKWLHDTLERNDTQARYAITGIKNDLAAVKEEREKTNKTIIDKLDHLDQRLTKVDGDHDGLHDVAPQ
jgi:hypothetical protein